MKYVIDSSVAGKWVLLEADSAKARSFRDDYARGIHHLVAPDIFPAELGHMLTRAERQKRVTVGEAESLWQGVMIDYPQLYSYLPLMLRALEISSTVRIGIYDCLYAALAEREGCELLTADDKLMKNLHPTFPFIIGLSSLP